LLFIDFLNSFFITITSFIKKMKRIFLLISITFVLQLSAQKSINALVQAERSFAGFTAKQGIKAGFLEFLDSTGVVFNGADAVNGITRYQSSPSSPLILNWAPEYALISASKDFGFTTGPYHLQRSLVDSVIGRGQYSSIWHINKQGEWKVLADLGTVYTDHRSLPEKSAEIDLSNITTEKFSWEDVKESDQQINQRIELKGGIAVSDFLTTQSWLNSNGQAPVMGAKNIIPVITKLQPGSKLSFTGGAIASSNDLAFTYGKLMNENTYPYMRVWTKQKTGWVLLLQVISW
jgi:hypothetical protein